MEESSYVCGMNHLDGDNRLPPRKRLLAGLKKQNCDNHHHNSASPSPSSSSMISSSFSSRLNNLLNSNSKSSTRLSPDEILDASKSAALAAAKVAAAARARATEKAEVAAKAVAAAKTALELVASVSEETSGKERKNRSKKHMPVELLYKKRRSGMKCETDEEIARKLHRAMNSSPRISKGSLPSDLKTHNHKKHRKQLKLENCRVSDGGELRAPHTPSSACVRIAEAGDMNFRGRVGAVELLSMGRKDEKEVLCTKADRSDMDISPPDRETEASCLNDKYWQVTERGGTTGRKRGRIKQKKLSLSLCTIRDRENPKEEPKSNGFPSMKEPHGKCAAEMPLFSANPSTKDPMVTTGSAL